jgi:hypothetical protein
MGSARRVLDSSPFQELAESNLIIQFLEEDVRRTRQRFSTGKKNGTKAEAYVKALIRFNEFLLQEKAKMMAK